MSNALLLVLSVVFQSALHVLYEGLRRVGGTAHAVHLHLLRLVDTLAHELLQQCLRLREHRGRVLVGKCHYLLHLAVADVYLHRRLALETARLHYRRGVDYGGALLVFYGVLADAEAHKSEGAESDD
jgi:dolichol kinase